MDDIYTVFGKIAANPELGLLRMPRSTPFLMVAAGRHFIVYDQVDDKVVVLTVLHQVRDIERIIAAAGLEFLAEIQAIRARGFGELL